MHDCNSLNHKRILSEPRNPDAKQYFSTLARVLQPHTDSGMFLKLLNTWQLDLGFTV